MDSETVLRLIHKSERDINSGPVSTQDQVMSASALIITYGLIRIAEAIEKTIEKN